MHAVDKHGQADAASLYLRLGQIEYELFWKRGEEDELLDERKNILHTLYHAELGGDQ